MRVVLIIILSISMLTSAFAGIRYVTDDLSINLRSGKSNEHKIIQLLNSGTAVDVLEESEDGYARVKTDDGKEGWVLDRYLGNEPGARIRLEKLEKNYTDLKQNFEQQVENRLKTVQDELSELRTTAASQIQLSQENRKLRKSLTEQTSLQDTLALENASLADQSKRKWFVTGAGVTLGSLLLGLIIPRIPWRKRRRWDEL